MRGAGRHGHINCNCFDWRILWRVRGCSEHTHSNVSWTVLVKGGIEQCWQFSVCVVVAGGPLGKFAKGFDDIAQGVTDVVVEGSFVVGAIKEVVTKWVHVFFAVGTVGGVAAAQSERKPQFALAEDCEDIIIKPVVFHSSAKVVEWVGGEGGEDGWHGN